jgi:hypothetical protein
MIENTATATMNGMSTTGTVHAAHPGTVRGVSHLMQNCGTSPAQHASLTPTDEAVTCGRCLRLTPKTAPAPRPAATELAASPAGPSTWGVFADDGVLRIWRTTRREALAAAGESDTVRKL